MTVCNGILADHNSRTAASLSIRMFPHTVQHILRIARVLRMRDGHLMLLGDGATGKRSLARLAAFIVRAEVVSASPVHQGTAALWHANLRDATISAGLHGVSTVLLLTESHLMAEPVLHQLSEVFCGMAHRRLNQADLAAAAKEMKLLLPDPDSVPACELEAHFSQRVLRNLHCVICMPLGGSGIKRIAVEYPFLLQLFTINVIGDLDESTHELIGTSHFESVVEECKAHDIDGALPPASVLGNLVASIHRQAAQVAQQHECASVLSAAFFENLRLSSQILPQKLAAHHSKQQRYVKGLACLEDTRKALLAMHSDLDAMQV
jgi:hypothetical protein